MAIAKSRSIMGKDQFEKYFEDQLKDYELSVDTQELWEGIEPELPPVGRSSKWLYSTLLLILLMGFALWMINDNDQSNHSSEKTEMSVASGLMTESPSGPESGSVAMTVDRAENEEHSLDEDEKEGELEMDSDNGTTALGSAEEGKPSFNSTAQSLSRREKEPTLQNVRFGMKKSASKANQTTQDPSIVDLMNQIAQETGAGMNTQEDVTIRFSPRPAAQAAKDAGDAKAASGNLGLRMPVVVANLDQGAGVDLVTQSEYISSVPGLNDCYNFSERFWAWSLDVYGGLHYSQKLLSADEEGGEVDDYLAAREETESHLESFSLGLALNLMHRSGFVASAGINYSQINEKFNFINQRSVTRFDSVVVRVNIDSSGMIDSIREWRPVTIQYTEEILTYNSFRMVDIPIGIGYQWAMDKMVFEAQAGAMFNLAFIDEGEMFDGQLNIVEIDENIFDSQVGFSAWLGVKALYPISSHWSVYAEPVARFNLVPVTVDGYELTQRYNRFGMRLGARMTF